MKTKIAIVIMTCLFAVKLPGNTIFSDDFNGPALNTNLWRMPTWKNGGDDLYLGRTWFKSVLSPLPAVGNGIVSVTAQSWDGSGYSISGTDLISNAPFYVGNGLIITAVLNLDTVKKGTVAALFMYGAPKDGRGWKHDEIDFEFVGNFSGSFCTNIYGDESLGIGHPKYFQYANVGAGMTGRHKYQIRWLPNQVSWYIDDVLVRTVTSAESPIPQGPMYLHFNMWAPDTTWADAFSSDVVIAKSKKENEIWSMSVDSVSVESDQPQILTSLEIDPPASFEVGVSGTQEFEAAAIDQNQNSILTPMLVVWQSSNPAVAKIDQNGLLTALSPGVANITASLGSVTSQPTVVTVPTSSVVIKKVPAYGHMGSASGVVNGLASGEYRNYKIATYINVSGWWTKPTFAHPLVSISKKGSWSADVTTGGIDEYASEIRAYLIPKGVVPPACSGDHVIPDSLSQYLYDSVYREEVSAPYVLKSIALVKKPTKLVVGGLAQRIVVEPRNNKKKPFSVGLVWSSSNTSVATVDTTGLVTPVGKGSSTITVKATTNSKIRASVKVAVK